MIPPGTAALSIANLDVSFRIGGDWRRAVRDVSFDVQPGETFALVGESGSGKSLTAMSLMGLLPSTARIAGAIRIDGRDMAGSNEREWNEVRGKRIAMVFQNPMSSLNPLLTIGEQLVEAIRRHQPLGKDQATLEALRLIDRMRLPYAERQFTSYPHELSGGMRQRIMLAIAIANRPDVLIADEPTTALDVEVQTEILDLFAEIQRETRMAMLLITHDLGLVAERADRVAVMYAGALVEIRPARDLMRAAAHPYTSGLIGARPQRRPATGPRPRLADIPGQVPPLQDIPARGCSFAPRCALAETICSAEAPPLVVDGNGSFASCHALAVRIMATE